MTSTAISTNCEAARTGNLSAININSPLNRRTNGRWHAARQLVAIEIQQRELGQETQVGWNRTR